MNPNDVNKHVVDGWTFVHLLGGMLLSRAGVGFKGTMAFAILWELVEIELKKRYPQAFIHPGQDTPANMVGDIAAYGAGWAAVKAAGRHP